ncbi:MAG TPA: hypothetical protein ENJ08_12200 [Gammaproteobacteria bacterium]|nr:hypothetical protein [Gammaproteobacteria bacterium]
MIRLIQTIPAGNALRLFLTPLEIATRWRVLRRTDDSFSDFDDKDAVLVYESTQAVSESVHVDSKKLVNGIRYYYRVYYSDGFRWIATESVSAIPESTYRADDNDVLSFVRERLQLGLVQAIIDKQLFPNSGKIAVLNAPPQFENAAFPVVTIHIDKDAPAERFLGESLYEDQIELTGDTWIETEGWLAQWSLSIIGWSMNPDERIALRNAIKRILLINLPVFDAWGMDQVSFDFSDSEDLNSYPAPIYQVITNFTCIAPAYVSASTGSRVSDVQLIVR